MPDAPEHISFSYDPEVAASAQHIGTGHLHWTITAFQRWGEDGTMIDSVTVVVEGRDEQEAHARAQAVIVREKYRTSAVNEACSIDPTVVHKE